MGQIARLDTFLDFIFIVIIIDCPELVWWLVVAGFYMACKLLWDILVLIKNLKMKTDFGHTMPYMESVNYLSFLRENMLLGTVLDSFCINNTLTLGSHHVVFGRMMGALSFFLQDFP